LCFIINNVIYLVHLSAVWHILRKTDRFLSFHRVRYCEIIADNLSKAGWSWGCVATVDSRSRAIFVADAHRDENQRFIARADDKLTAFVTFAGADAKGSGASLRRPALCD
jgi:hypothetical protein